MSRRRPRPIRPPIADPTSAEALAKVAARREAVIARAVEAVCSFVDRLPWCRCGARAVIVYACRACNHVMGEPRDRCGGCTRWRPGYVRRVRCYRCKRVAEVIALHREPRALRRAA